MEKVRAAVQNYERIEEMGVTREPNDVTQLLINWREGEEDVPARLMALIYEEARHLAQKYLRRDRSDHTHQASALVHEAYLRLIDDKQASPTDRAHFYKIAARIVRRILVDQARAYHAASRRSSEEKRALDEKRGLTSTGAVDLVALDSALETFGQTYPRKSEVVELKFFGGLDAKKISEVLQVSEKAVLRDWNFAKLWLCRAISNGA
jgi:RNA polymerase sigma factor (TIGR02999 family)